MWLLSNSNQDAGRHKAPGNGTYFEAKDPATGQAQTPHQAEDTTKHPTPDSTNQHKAKHPIQNQLKEEEEEIWTFSYITYNQWNGGRLIKLNEKLD